MREYFRLEKITFRYLPVIILTRLLFAALVIVMGYVQCFVMVLAAPFSVGFVQATEEELLIPMTEAERKRKRVVRATMIAIRYAILGMISYVFGYFYPLDADAWAFRILAEKPFVCAFFFLFQMAVVYSNLLDSVLLQVNPWESMTAFNVIHFGLPQILFFVYAVSAIGLFGSAKPFICEFSDGVNVAVLLTLTALTAVRIVKMIRGWRTGDFKPDKKKAR